MFDVHVIVNVVVVNVEVANVVVICKILIAGSVFADAGVVVGTVVVIGKSTAVVDNGFKTDPTTKHSASVMRQALQPGHCCNTSP